MLIVLQVVFSILFMCFAGAVYTFQGQWRDKALDAQKLVADLNIQIDEEKQANIQNLEEEKTLRVKAENERDTARTALQDAETAAASVQNLLQEVRQERDKAIAEIEAATSEAGARVAEATALRAEVASRGARNTSLVSSIRNLEDANLQLLGQVEDAKDKEENNLKEIGRLMDLLRQNGVDPRRPVLGPVPADIDKVEGFVENTRMNRSRSQEYVHITIGSDDKIRKDMELIVYRLNKYLGKIRIVEVYPDFAVALVEEKVRNGTIQRGDNVTTKL